MSKVEWTIGKLRFGKMELVGKAGFTCHDEGGYHHDEPTVNGEPFLGPLSMPQWMDWVERGRKVKVTIEVIE